ncbi:Rod binding protein [Sphingomonas laterariae]|uniref:Rod binding protein n=1 Tax=Edaphosphingomonas laterariae TaxID=861865 RepID=A0A239KLH5_9SPHN|nr:rod-binding protein [Sphingomonas laterariae]SNT18572.1 Rod binding protein [Sphingomonas laterariae]
MADISSAAMLPPAGPQLPKPRADAAATAREFEAVFVGQITKMMMEMVETGDEFSGGHGEQMFRGVLAEQMGNEIAKRGGIGLAPAVMDQILKMQGGSADGR